MRSIDRSSSSAISVVGQPVEQRVGVGVRADLPRARCDAMSASAAHDSGAPSSGNGTRPVDEVGGDVERGRHAGARPSTGSGEVGEVGGAVVEGDHHRVGRRVGAGAAPDRHVDGVGRA